jgi:formate hydrogenlyase subunit 6/NADH:ubiquinone oxidoreductase subunit I
MIGKSGNLIDPKIRIFSYQHYQCVCCGACVNACPEEAAALRHEISHKKFFRILSRQEIKAISRKG